MKVSNRCDLPRVICTPCRLDLGLYQFIFKEIYIFYHKLEFMSQVLTFMEAVYEASS